MGAGAGMLLSSSALLTEDDTYDGYESDLGITAIALYDYQAGEALTGLWAQMFLPWVKFPATTLRRPFQGRNTKLFLLVFEPGSVIPSLTLNSQA